MIDLRNSHFLRCKRQITVRLPLDITKLRDEVLALISVAARARNALPLNRSVAIDLRKKLRTEQNKMGAEEIAGWHEETSSNNCLPASAGGKLPQRRKKGEGYHSHMILKERFLRRGENFESTSSSSLFSSDHLIYIQNFLRPHPTAIASSAFRTHSHIFLFARLLFLASQFSQTLLTTSM